MISNKDSRYEALGHWLSQHGYNNVQLQTASSDASARRYFRFHHCATSLIAVDTPLAVGENQSFMDIAQTLQRAGIRTPEIYHADPQNGWMVVEDFGSQTFAQALVETNKKTALYAAALRIISQLHESALLQDTCEKLPSYSESMVYRELEIFTHWCLNRHLDVQLSSSEQADWQSICALLARVFGEQPQTFVHRDFHSRNLMQCDDGSLGLLDFQGAVCGPLTYDWASLLRDCYVALPQAEVHSLLASAYEERFSKKLRQQQTLQEVTRWFDLTGLQRHLKAIGIFCRLKQQDGKSTYINDIPRTFNYVLEVTGRYEELTPLHRIFERHSIAARLC